MSINEIVSGGSTATNCQKAKSTRVYVENVVVVVILIHQILTLNGFGLVVIIFMRNVNVHEERFNVLNLIYFFYNIKIEHRLKARDFNHP